MNTTFNFTGNLTSNVTNPGPPAGPQGSPTLADALKVAFASSFYMFAVSLVTIVANGLLLFLFFKTPSRWFRQPSAYFLAGLAAADLLTGLVPIPLNASCFMMGYFRAPGFVVCNKVLFDVASSASVLTFNVSILIILAFTATQCMVVISPLRCAPMITSRRVVVCVVLIWVYAILFQTSYYMGVPFDVFYKIDMFLNTLTVTLATIALYIVLRKAFQRNLEKSLQLRSADSVHQLKANRASANRVEKHFVTLNGFLIALYVVCMLPNAGYWFVSVYWKVQGSPALVITSLICDDLIYLKFALDPFLFAWRLPKYSQALKNAIGCHFGSEPHEEGGRTNDEQAATRVSYIIPETETSKL